MNKKVSDEDLRDFIQILKYAYVKEISEAFGISERTVYRRMRILLDRGMVISPSRGRFDFVKPISTSKKRSLDKSKGSATLPIAGTGKQRKVADKETQALLRSIASQIIRVSSGNHSIYRVVETGKTVVVASTPSDRRALANLKADLIRAGVKF